MKKKAVALILSVALMAGIISMAGATTGARTLDAYFYDMTVYMDGKQVPLTDVNGTIVEPFAVNGTTYLPIRALSELLGFSVDWDGLTQDQTNVYLTSGAKSGTETEVKSGLVPGLVELTVFGNHEYKPASRMPENNGQIFNTGYTPDNAPVYVNPLVFDYNYSQSAGQKLGQVSDDPFGIGKMIADGMTGDDPTSVQSYTHTQNANLFRGTGTYIQENGSRSAADPHGIYYNHTWYVYASGGYQLKSTDFVKWEVVPALQDNGNQMGFTAPSVDYTVDANGVATFYLAWNSSHIYKSVGSPTGPWTDLGDFTYRGLSFSENLKYNYDGVEEEDGSQSKWTGGTYGSDKAATPYESEDALVMASHDDVNIFVDREDNNRMYLCWGMGAKWMSIAELNPENPSELKSAPVEVITFDPTYGFEGFGQYNQDYETGFAEGSMLFKYKGVYYWTVATGGTQYDGYTFLVYKNTTGDLLNKDAWVYQPRDVIAPDNDDALWGSVRGGGHGSIAVDTDHDVLWCFYTVNIGYEGDMERRLGADPAYIDDNGYLTVPHLSETPQYAPGVLKNPCGAAGNTTGSDILSTRQGYGVSSYSEGRHPMYAGDESPLTWWQPAADDAQPWYVVSLKGLYNVEGIRVMLKDVETNRSNTYGVTNPTYSYKIEVYNGHENPITAPTSTRDSNAGWVTVAAVKDANILNYIDLPDIPAQFVRITFTDWTGKIS